MSFSHSAGCWQWLSGSQTWRYMTKALPRLSLSPKPLNACLLIRPYEWDWLHLNKRVQFAVHLCSGHFTKWASSLQPYPQRCRKLNESQAAQWVSGWIMQLILLLFIANVSKKLLQKNKKNTSSVHLAAAFVLNADMETMNQSLRMFSDNMIFTLHWCFYWNWMNNGCCLDLQLLNAQCQILPGWLPQFWSVLDASICQINECCLFNGNQKIKGTIAECTESLGNTLRWKCIKIRRLFQGFWCEVGTNPGQTQTHCKVHKYYNQKLQKRNFTEHCFPAAFHPPKL